MGQVFNVYCDESCHLLNDHQKAMTLGATWCCDQRLKEISLRLREIKLKHGLPRNFEVKWRKVSASKIEFYRDWLDYFFDDDDLHFRAVVISDKSSLRHREFSQTHDDWYYKMHFVLLSWLLKPEERFRVYLDWKDTKSAAKARDLQDVLCNSAFDFNREIIERVQPIHSHESDLLQLADFLIGIVGCANRGITTSPERLALVERMRERSRLSLTRTTLLKATKVNLLLWKGGSVPGE